MDVFLLLFFIAHLISNFVFVRVHLNGSEWRLPPAAAAFNHCEKWMHLRAITAQG